MADDEDYLDSDMQAKQRRLIMRITQGRVLQALISWRVRARPLSTAAGSA